MYNANVPHPETTKAPEAETSSSDSSAPVSPDTLNDLDKQYYDVWREQNPDTPFTTDVLQSFGYYQDALDDPTNVNAYRALIDPSLVKPMTYTDPESGKVISYRVVTPEAIDMMGGTFALSGSGKNDIYILPSGTKGVHQHSFYSQDITEGAYAGMTQVVSTGNPSGQFSLLGSVGLDDEFAKIVPDEVKAPVGMYVGAIPGVSDSLLLGTEWSRGSVMGLSKISGLKPEEVQTAESVAKVVAQTVLLGTGFLAPVAIGIEATSQANSVAAGQRKWNEALVSSVVYAASAMTGNVYASAALNAGYSALRGEETKAILESTVWNLAAGYANGVNPYGGLAVNAVRTQVDPNYTNADFAASAIVAGISKAPLNAKTDFAGANKKYFSVTAADGSAQLPGGPLINWDSVPSSWLPADSAPMDDLHGYSSPAAGARGGPTGGARRPPAKAQKFEDLFSGFTPEAYYKPKYV